MAFTTALLATTAPVLAGHAWAQELPLPRDSVLRGDISAGTPLTDDNLNGIEDADELPPAPAQVFDESVQDEEERLRTEEPELPDAAQAPAAAVDLRENQRALRAQQVGVDLATGELTPLANRAAEPVQGGASPEEDDPFAALGLRTGSFTIFPVLEQSVGYTTNADFAEDGEASAFSLTRGEVQFVSDWNRHRLRGGIAGAYTKFLNGESDDLPTVDANAELRLDMANDIAVTFGGAYRLATESAVTGNVAVPNAAEVDGRPIVQQGTAFAEIARNGRRFTPRLRLQLDRLAYGDVDLSDGSTFSQATRDNTLATATLRLGYEVSPAWQPFVEASIGGRYYDEDIDLNGDDRLSFRYALRTGAAFDKGEKLRGEIAIGYANETFASDRLEDLGGVTGDATIAWSPQRFTTITATGGTTFFGSTDAGESGSITYSGQLALEHELRRNVTLNARVQAALRDFTGSDRQETSYQAEAGAEWQMNRGAAIFGTVGYETVDSTEVGSSYEAITARAGIRIRR